MKNETLKVGDRVKWSGIFLNLHSKYSVEELNEILSKSIDEVNKFLRENEHLKTFKKGVGKIKKIEYDDLFHERMVTLYNGKMFSLNDESLTKIN